LRCVQRSPESVESPATTAGAEQRAQPAGEQDAGPGLPGTEVAEAAEPQPPEDEDQPEASLNPIARYLRNSDAHDRDLLATIERETKRSPSPEVMELLSMRRAGVAPQELARFIDTELPNDVRVRMAARRWLRESNGTPAPPASPLPGAGGGARRVAPIAPR
jgi:hypothetical protein